MVFEFEVQETSHTGDKKQAEENKECEAPNV